MSTLGQWDGFDDGPGQGTNRSAPIHDCQTCGGDRFVPVQREDLVVAEGKDGGYTEAMLPCPSCNPVDRPAVDTDSWWKGDA